MVGRKPMTVPTPCSTPSMRSACMTGLTPAAVSPASMASVTPLTSSSMSEVSHAPMPLNVMRKMNAMMPRKIGMAV